MAYRWRTVQRVAGIVLLAVILACYVADGLEAIRANTNSSDFDQRSYLGLAIDIQDGDALTDGNRHPLYPALLAPFAQRKWSFYTTSKFFSLGLGVLTLLFIYDLVRRRCRAEIGLLVILLLSQNPEFLRVTSHVMSEALLVPLFTLAWYLTDRGLDCPYDEARPRTRFLIAAGAVTGLVYLTKGTGQLLAMIFVPVALWTYRRHLRKAWPGLLGYLGGYSVVAAPLWIYNQGKYGSPFYNYNTTHTFWFDAWEEKYVSGELPTWISYFRSHSLSEIVARQWRGMGTVLPIWGEATLPDTTALVLLASAAFLLVAALIAEGGQGASPRLLRASLFYDGVLIGLHYLLFAWYAQVYVAPRFFLPLTPALCLLGVGAVYGAARRLSLWLHFRDTRPRSILRGLYLVLPLVLGLGLLADSAQAFRTIATNPYDLDRENGASSDAMFTWVKHNLAVELMHQDTSVDFLWGPSTTLGSWRYEARNDFDEIPSDFTSWAELEAFIADKELDYVLMDADTVERRRPLLSPYFAVDDNRVSVLAIPSGWALTYAESGMPCRWCLFQLLDREPIRNPLSLTFGDSIRLLGYDVVESEVRPDEDLHFMLYWQALAPLNEDYTVLVRLSGADGALLSQSDAAPLQGQAPTSSWLPGAVYADRYELPVPKDAPHGAAHLEVELYRHAPTEKLPVSAEAGQSLSDNRVLLPAAIAISEQQP